MTYNPSDHPRAPKGTPAGGQFTNKAGVGSDSDLQSFNNLFDYQHKNMVVCTSADGSEYYVDISQERADFASQHPNLTALVGNWQDYTFDQLRALNFGLEHGYDITPVANPTQYSFETINAYTQALQDGANPVQVAYIAMSRENDDTKQILLSLAADGAGDWLERGFNANQTRWVIAAKRAGVNVNTLNPDAAMKKIHNLTKRRLLIGAANKRIVPEYKTITSQGVTYGADLVEPYYRIAQRART